MFNFFHFIKVKVEHIKFTSINQLYYLKNKKLSLLIKRTLNNNNWQLVFYFDDLEKKDIDFICHQINIEYLAQIVQKKRNFLFLDSVVGTDSHTTMVNAVSSVSGQA